MRLLHFSAGTASIYRGSAIGDNALAAELIRRGHDVTLLPLFTPTRTDEENVSRLDRVFFGAVSVYLEQHFAPFRHTPAALDRLWDGPGVIEALSSRSIIAGPKMPGAIVVSILEGEGGRQQKEFDKLLAWLADDIPPDLVNIPSTLLISLAGPLKRALGGVPIVVTLQGEDLVLDGLPPPLKRKAIDLIRSHAGEVDRFIAASRYGAERMLDYLRIPAAKMAVAPPGVSRPEGDEPAPLARRPFTIGYLARIAPEKGLRVLAEAYGILRRTRGLPPSRLLAAGSCGPDQQAYFDGVTRELASMGLAGEFEYAGTPDRTGKFRFLRELDVFCVPAPYPEPRGLYLLEAMAAGVPVVAPNHGAFPELISATGGGTLARSAEPAEIADAIHELWQDPSRAAVRGRQGRAAVSRDFTQARMAERVEAIYEDLC